MIGRNRIKKDTFKQNSSNSSNRSKYDTVNKHKKHHPWSLLKPTPMVTPPPAGSPGSEEKGRHVKSSQCAVTATRSPKIKPPDSRNRHIIPVITSIHWKILHMGKRSYCFFFSCNVGVSLWYSGLKIWHCHCSSLGPCCGVALIPGPGTSICHRSGKKEKTNKQTKNTM